MFEIILSYFFLDMIL